MLSINELVKIDELNEIYEGYKKWEWRFGETPSFTNAIEKKFDWALVDLELNVEKGVITRGRAWSDCLVPTFIDSLNEILESGTITYDLQGVAEIGEQLRQRHPENEMITGKFVPELVEWMTHAI